MTARTNNPTKENAMTKYPLAAALVATVLLAARGSCADAVSRVAAADKYANGGYLVARSRRPADTDTRSGP